MGISMHRPNHYSEFKDYKEAGMQIQCTCISCGAEFSPENVRSSAAWRETQISGMCENCWDELFEDLDEVD